MGRVARVGCLLLGVVLHLQYVAGGGDKVKTVESLTGGEASPTEIMGVNLQTAVSRLATAPLVFHCTYCMGDGTRKAAYAQAGGCARKRVGEALIEPGTTSLPGVVFPFASTYVLCYAQDGITWTEQTSVNTVMEVSNACEKSPCLNGGVCYGCVDGGYSCSCVGLYEGDRCEKRPHLRPAGSVDEPVDPCLMSPCHNGGECVASSVSERGFVCSCAAKSEEELFSYVGDTCADRACHTPFNVVDHAYSQCAVFIGDLTVPTHYGHRLYLGDLQRIEGDLVFEGHADFPALRGISGDLIIQGHHNPVTIVSLPSLVSIGRNLAFSNEYLEEVERGLLQKVGGSVMVKGNGALESLELPLLDSVESLSIRDNEKLLSVSLPFLKSAEGGITITTNKHLEEVGLGLLLKVGGSVMVKDNDALEILELPLLDSVGSLSIRDNEKLVKVSLPSLTSAEGGITITTKSGGECDTTTLPIECGDAQRTTFSVALFLATIANL